MEKESLFKFAVLALMGLALTPIFWAVDFVKSKKHAPTCQEILFASTIKKVK
jgi:hypothetical protein